MRATEGSGGAEVAQVVGTVHNGLFTAFQGQEVSLSWWVMVMVRVQWLLLERLCVFWCSSNKLQHPRELAVASLTVGATVARLASVAGLARRRGDLGAGR